MLPGMSPSLLNASVSSEDSSPRTISSEAVFTEKRRFSRRLSSTKAPLSLAETLKAAIDEGMPSAKPLSSLLLHCVTVELVLQLLVMLLLLASSLLPCEFPIEDCVVMTVILALAIIFQIVFNVKLQQFNFSADHINLSSLLRDAETLSDEVRNVHLNKSISTIAVQREINGVLSYERNMAAVVPVNSLVKFHPSEKNNLPVGIPENSSAKIGSRWIYACVSQNLAVDCLKRLLQRRRSPSFDPLTRNTQLVLHRLAYLLIIVASAILLAFVRNPVAHQSVVFGRCTSACLLLFMMTIRILWSFPLCL